MDKSAPSGKPPKARWIAGGKIHAPIFIHSLSTMSTRMSTPKIALSIAQQRIFGETVVLTKERCLPKGVHHKSQKP